MFGVYIVKNPETGATVFTGTAGAPFEDRFLDDLRAAIRCGHSPRTSAIRALLEAGLQPTFEVLAVSANHREIRILRDALKRKRAAGMKSALFNSAPLTT
jgi:hypothetical protein